MSRLRRKLSPQLRLLTDRNKLYTTMKISTTKEYVAKVEAELAKICEGIIALMDKNLIPSARRIARAEGHQQRTLKRSSSLSKSSSNRPQRSGRQERHES